MPRPAGSIVKLRVAFGEVPEFGTILETRTGRRYQIVEVKGKSLRCLVLGPNDLAGDDPVLSWHWVGRRP